MPDTSDALEVAVAVIVREDQVLLSKRPRGKKHAGLWEFPGGKFESGEDLGQALKREIMEELGVEVLSYKALMAIPHSYPDYAVNLRVAMVTEFFGEPHGRENQEIAWIALDQLSEYSFPQANQAILGRLADLLPD
jgi:8-oxo-dGTP diphosphatase